MKRRDALTALLTGALGACEPLLKRPKRDRAAGTVTVYSTTDRAVFQPVIDDFAKVWPEIAVRYVELDARPLYSRFVSETAAGQRSADILISSAMDLQVKLVNDGYALPHRSPDGDLLPPWARWRHEVFGLTFEPVVMVVNPAAMNGVAVPRSRGELVRTLKADHAFWNRRIGTYDMVSSSVGRFLAGQDDRLSSEFGSLIDAMGHARARPYHNTSSLLDDLVAGTIALGYNVLGSYAKRRIEAGAALRLVYPEDYTLAVVRAAFIAKHAPNPQGAHAFLNYLLSLRGQRILATRSYLSAVREEIDGPYGRLGIRGSTTGPLRPIPIGPGLLTYLDAQKQARFQQKVQSALGAGGQ